MKQKQIFVLLLFLFAASNSYAQKNKTKCPPRKAEKKYNVKKPIKLPSLNFVKAKKEEINQDEVSKKRDNYYIKAKKVKSGSKRVKYNTYASTKCPR